MISCSDMCNVAPARTRRGRGTFVNAHLSSPQSFVVFQSRVIVLTLKLLAFNPQLSISYLGSEVTLNFAPHIRRMSVALQVCTLAADFNIKLSVPFVHVLLTG